MNWTDLKPGDIVQDTWRVGAPEGDELYLAVNVVPDRRDVTVTFLRLETGKVFEQSFIAMGELPPSYRVLRGQAVIVEGEGRP